MWPACSSVGLLPLFSARSVILVLTSASSVPLATSVHVVVKISSMSASSRFSANGA